MRSISLAMFVAVLLIAGAGIARAIPIDDLDISNQSKLGDVPKEVAQYENYIYGEVEEAKAFLKSITSEYLQKDQKGYSYCTPDTAFTKDKGIDPLNPAFAICAANFIRAYTEAYGTQVYIGTAYRTPRQQKCLCPVAKRGCAAPARYDPVTAVASGGSNHQRGIAIDLTFKAVDSNGVGINENFRRIHSFARNNPQFGVSFPLGMSDRYHLQPSSSKCTTAGWKIPLDKGQVMIAELGTDFEVDPSILNQAPTGGGETQVASTQGDEGAADTPTIPNQEEEWNQAFGTGEEGEDGYLYNASYLYDTDEDDPYALAFGQSFGSLPSTGSNYDFSRLDSGTIAFDEGQTYESLQTTDANTTEGEGEGSLGSSLFSFGDLFNFTSSDDTEDSSDPLLTYGTDNEATCEDGGIFGGTLSGCDTSSSQTIVQHTPSDGTTGQTTQVAENTSQSGYGYSTTGSGSTFATQGSGSTQTTGSTQSTTGSGGSSFTSSQQVITGSSQSVLYGVHTPNDGTQLSGGSSDVQFTSGETTRTATRSISPAVAEGAKAAGTSVVGGTYTFVINGLLPAVAPAVRTMWVTGSGAVQRAQSI